MRAKRRPSTVTPPAPRSGGRARLKGRHWVALWLLAFLLMALAVIRRQSAALEATRELQQLRRTRGALEVSRSGLVGEIDRARSRAVLVPLAEQKLGLRLPQDSEITILQDPGPR
jgi:preprotein translocase subunit YajC